MKTTIRHLLLLVCALGVGSALSADQPVLTELDQGEKACLECHDGNEVTAILGTPHFVHADPRTPAGNVACESCHGPSSEHSRFPQQVASIRFGEGSSLSLEEQSDICLGCHQGDHVNWSSSTHAAEDMSCLSCHSVHTQRDAVLDRMNQTDVCFSCHVAEKMQTNKPYRHPVREGAVVCTDCHNPHGSNGPSMLTRQSVNETCFMCHTEKRGPFAMEHEPVQDDCLNCHTPHGSNHENLLSVRPPFLCQQCHSDHSHGRDVLGPGDESVSSGRVVGGSCVNCHSQVHGSNRPGARPFFD